MGSPILSNHLTSLLQPSYIFQRLIPAHINPPKIHLQIFTRYNLLGASSTRPLLLISLKIILFKFVAP